jgi:hypothetical protein
VPTVLQLYNDAFADAGGQQPNQTASGSNIDFIHRRFNDMVRTWSKIRERLFFIPAASYTLTADLGAYQIGPGAAQFNTNNVAPNPLYTKPVFIQSAQVIVGTNRKWPLNILTRPQWDVLTTTALVDPDGPTDLFYDFNQPIATINLAPLPASTQTLIMSQWNQLQRFFPGDEALLVENYYPESYLLALRKGLAIELIDPFRFPASQSLLGIFQGAIQAIENDNRSKVVGAFGFSRTLETGATKGDGIMAPAQPQ